MRTRYIIPIAIAIILAIVALYIMHGVSGEKTLVIYCAGSLKLPLDKLSSIYSSRTGVEVHVEASGSVEAVRKVTELGKNPDIVAVADYKLIRDILVSKGYTSWYIGFATNELVLVYHENSRYINKILSGEIQWYEALAKPGVRWGFSNPNADPCGYRAIGLIALASIYYNDTELFNHVLGNRTNIEITFNNDTIEIHVPPSIERYSDDIVIRPKSVDLISLVESGSIDYVFEYRSVALQHNLSYIEFPDQINLGNPDYTEYYERVRVHLMSGSEDEVEIPLDPIMYGVTMLDNALHREYAIEYLKLLLGPEGRNVFESMGQKFLDKPVYYGDVPDQLRV